MSEHLRMPFLTSFSPGASRAIPALPVSEDLRVKLAPRVPPVRRVRKEILEIPALWVWRDPKVPQDRKGNPGKQARRAFKVSAARRASKDLREIPEIPDLRDPKDLKAIPENRVKRVLPVRRVFPVKWVLSVPLVRREKKETRLPMPILPRSSWPR